MKTFSPANYQIEEAACADNKPPTKVLDNSLSQPIMEHS